MDTIYHITFYYCWDHRTINIWRKFGTETSITVSIVNLLSSNFDTVLLSVESELSLLSGWQFVGQVEWLSPTNFLHICWKQAKFNFHPDNFVQQLQSCESFGIALRSDNHIFLHHLVPGCPVWCLVTSKGSSHQPEKSLAALILAATESTCYFFVYLHWFQLWPPGGATCISYKFGHQVAPLALPWIALLAI